MYDLIGDIHGCADTLRAMLVELGYSHDGQCYRHRDRQAIFLGDFIDRGPLQRDAVNTARSMVEHGAALAVMGNHEFNALGYHTPNPRDPDNYLRTHSDKNRQQHQAFLDAYGDDAAERQMVLAWFAALPLWLDLKSSTGALRVVHACWDPASMEVLQPFLDEQHRMTERLLVRASRKGTPEYAAVETLLKGKEVRLPAGLSFRDKGGHERHEVRIRWWEHAGSFRSLALGPETGIPDDPVGVEHLITYSHDAPPVFLGHYWLNGDPTLLAPNIACVDYSVGIPGGTLVAYRWDGEQRLKPTNFRAVKRLEQDATA
ncbi:MAG: metallophosphoesterase [Gammaproteobacteria bacterium]